MANPTLLPDSLCDKDVVPLRAIESDCDRAQGQLRTLTAAWSGAALALLGTILVAASKNDVDPALRATLNSALHAACLAASLGTFIFGWFDQQVYQRLLHSAFGYGLLLENSKLGSDTIRIKVRTALYILNKDITPNITKFYFFQVALFFLASLGLLLATVPRHDMFVYPLLVVHVAFVVWAWCDMRRWSSLDDAMADLAKSDAKLKDAFEEVRRL